MPPEHQEERASRDPERASRHRAVPSRRPEGADQEDPLRLPQFEDPAELELRAPLTRLEEAEVLYEA